MCIKLLSAPMMSSIAKRGSKSIGFSNRSHRENHVSDVAAVMPDPTSSDRPTPTRSLSGFCTCNIRQVVGQLGREGSSSTHLGTRMSAYIEEGTSDGVPS